MTLPRVMKYAAMLAALIALQPATASRLSAEELQMWERSGGNKDMVDALVAAWNEANPDRKINLTYIPHTEMVPKLAQAIASGEVPDLMGMDLIYGPQFEAAGQLEDITDKIKDWPELKTASPGHMQVSTYDGRLYGVPLYADVSVLFWNKKLFAKAGLDPEIGPKSLQDIHDMAAKITALGDGTYGYYLAGNCAGCNIFTFGPLLWASGATIEPACFTCSPITSENARSTRGATSATRSARHCTTSAPVSQRISSKARTERLSTCSSLSSRLRLRSAFSYAARVLAYTVSICSRMRSRYARLPSAPPVASVRSPGWKTTPFTATW